MFTSALLLGTWFIATATILGVGVLVPARWTGADGPRSHALTGMWVGLCLLLLVVLGLSLLIPLTSPPAVAFLALSAMVGCASAARFGWTHRALIAGGLRRSWMPARWSSLVLVGLLAVGIVFAARFATAEPTDADLGLYRMNLVKYAEEFRVIPGLANLHERFGFNSSVWPGSAFLSNGVWAGQGFRVVTGLVLALLAATLMARILVPRARGATPGDWFTAIGTVFVAGLVVRDAGRWIASPAQDVIFLIAAVVSTGFLVDAVSSRGRARWASSGALATAALCGTVRPLGWLLLAASAAVVLVARRLGPRDSTAPAGSAAPEAFAGAIGLLLFAAMLVRDAVLTGWLLFPAAVLPLPVAWRVPDPTSLGEAITVYARAPLQADVTGVLTQWDWLSPWLASTRAAWETRTLAVLAIAAVLPLLWPRGRHEWRSAFGPMALAVLPSAIACVVWFITAPDLRFGWSALVGVIGVPLAFVVAGGAYAVTQFTAVGITAVVMSLVSVANSGMLTPRGGAPEPVAASIGPVPITLMLGPPRQIEPVPGTLGDGTPIIYPATSEQCWENFPLCLMTGRGKDVARLGDSIQDGFQQMLPAG